MRLSGSNNVRNSRNNVNFNEISRYNSISELNKILLKINSPRDKLLLEILIQTGITANELVNIKIQDLFLKENKLIIREENTKNKQTRTLKLNSKLIDQIKQYISLNKILSREFLFQSRQSSNISVRRLEQILGKYKLSSGEKITPQLVRRLYLENALTKKYNTLIKQNLGIKNLPKKRFVSHDNILKLKSQIQSEQHELILDILWQTGITINELVNLKKSDISFSQNILIIRPEITKSKFPRAIILNKELVSKIKKFSLKLSLSDFIFSSQKSSHISALRIRQILANYSQKSALDLIITPQILRNSHIVHAHSSGELLSSISERLGIKQLTTNTYGSLLFEDEISEDEKQRKKRKLET